LADLIVEQLLQCPIVNARSCALLSSHDFGSAAQRRASAPARSGFFRTCGGDGHQWKNQAKEGAGLSAVYGVAPRAPRCCKSVVFKSTDRPEHPHGGMRSELSRPPNSIHERDREAATLKRSAYDSSIELDHSEQHERWTKTSEMATKRAQRERRPLRFPPLV